LTSLAEAQGKNKVLRGAVVIVFIYSLTKGELFCENKKALSVTQSLFLFFSEIDARLLHDN
jgi:hypothetical protein